MKSALSYIFSSYHLKSPTTHSRDRKERTMILGASDCCTSITCASVHQLQLSSRARLSSLTRFPRNHNYLTSHNYSTNTSGCCRANLITDSESFQVGKLIGTYGFMNITRSHFFSCLVFFPFFFFCIFHVCVEFCTSKFYL